MGEKKQIHLDPRNTARMSLLPLSDGNKGKSRNHCYQQTSHRKRKWEMLEICKYEDHAVNQRRRLWRIWILWNIWAYEVFNTYEGYEEYSAWRMEHLDIPCVHNISRIRGNRKNKYIFLNFTFFLNIKLKITNLLVLFRSL